jgi:putative transposase
MRLKTFQYRLYPTKPQEQQMFQVLNVCRHFYNMCLEDRKLAYQLEKRSVGKNEQVKQARLYRQTFPQAGIVFSQTLQSVAIDVSKAFDAFFRRVKSGEKPGYPRFKSRNHFHSFNFPQFGVGAKLDGRRLKLFGIGRVRVRWHRPMEGDIKTLLIVYKAGQWFACFSCEVESKPELPKTGRCIGVDVGVSALITTSEGEKVEHPAYYRQAQARLRRVQRSLARKKKGGKNRRKALLTVQRHQVHTANQRSDMLHKLSTAMIQSCDGVALEDLKIRNMVRNHHLSKSILDSGWGMFKQYLTYKAASAGREICLVNPVYTSKCCSNCGTLFQTFDLSTRWVECGCGLSLDRDHNAALNILRKAGWDAPAIANVAPLPLPQGNGKGKRRIGSPRL